MSLLSDLFGGAGSASQAQQEAALAGIATAQNGANQANSAITTATNNAVAPSNQLFGTGTQGLGALGNLLGLGGAAGSQSALANLATMPGYQFTLGQGNNAINAAAAANGTLNSGNQATALANYGSGLAQGNYGNYVSQLAPYMNLASSAAGNIGQIYSTEGGQQAGVAQNQASSIEQALAGMGNAQANSSLSNQSMLQNLLGGGLKAGGSLLTAPFGGTGSTSLLGQLGSGISSGLSGLLFSDERLKEGIEPVGELFDGQEIYRYRYRGDTTNTTHIGVMAQDVAERNPDAVADIGGFLAVDYHEATNFAAALGELLEAA